MLISKTVAAPEPDSLVMADFGGSGSGDGDERRGAGVGVGRHHGVGGVGGVGGGHHHNYNQHHSASPSGRHGDAGWAGVDAEPDAVGHRHGSSSSSTSSSFSDADAEGSGASGAGPSIGGDWNENDAGSERGHDAKKPGNLPSFGFIFIRFSIGLGLVFIRAFWFLLPFIAFLFFVVVVVFFS